MTTYCGYMGKVLLLDLNTRTASPYIWTDREREKYIGGKAMASKILYDTLTGQETPFGEDNLIVIATGPLTGTGAPSSNRFDISSLSPLTGITSSSNCGGNFGLFLKKAGMDALIIRGKCSAPTWVEIDNGDFIFHDASELWGLKTGETQEAVQKALDAAHGRAVRCGMAVIGPAGENLVRYASVISGERAAGRKTAFPRQKSCAGSGSADGDGQAVRYAARRQRCENLHGGGRLRPGTLSSRRVRDPRQAA